MAANKNTMKDDSRVSEFKPDTTRASRLRSIPGEWMVCAVLLLVSVGFLVGSFEYPEAVRRWPLILSSTVIVLIVGYAAYRLWTRTFLTDAGAEARTKGEPAEAIGEHDGTPEALETTNDRAVLAAAISLVLFAILAYGVGFLLASIIFIGGYMIVAGHRKPSQVAGVVAGFAIAIYLLFGSTLNAPLNEGAWLWYSLEWLPV